MAGITRISGILLSLAALGVAAGCTVHVHSNPDAFEVPLEAPLKLRGGQTIDLANAYRVPTKSMIYSGGPSWEGDLQQYTNSAIALLGREMQKTGVSVGPSRKSVVLRVHSVEAAPGFWLIGSKLVLDAEYSDGTKSSILAEDNAGSAFRAVDGALVIAVAKLLVDARFQGFVNAE